MTDIFVPKEIWEHILLFLPLPSASRVCHLFLEIEEEIFDVRRRRHPPIEEYYPIQYNHRDWDLFRMNRHLCERHIGHAERSGISNIIYYVGSDGMLEIANLLRPFLVTLECRESLACGATKMGKKNILEWMWREGYVCSKERLYRYADKGHRSYMKEWIDRLAPLV